MILGLHLRVEDCPLNTSSVGLERVARFAHLGQFDHHLTKAVPLAQAEGTAVQSFAGDVLSQGPSVKWKARFHQFLYPLGGNQQ